VPTASLRQGNVTYLTQSGTRTLTPSDVASMDPNCSKNGTCPSGPGISKAALAYLSQLPLPNGNQLGDGYNFGSYAFSSPSPQKLSTYIAKMDYNLSASSVCFVRGNLQYDTTVGRQAISKLPRRIRRATTTRREFPPAHVWSI